MTMSGLHLDVIELLDLTPEQLALLDVRITDDEDGRPGRGCEIVVLHAKRQIDISAPLNTFFAEALARSIGQRFPSRRCGRHRIGRGVRGSLLATCTCAWVFESRLLVALDVVQLNEINAADARIAKAKAAAR